MMSDNIKTAFWILVTATVACFIIMVSIGVARAAGNGQTATSFQHDVGILLIICIAIMMFLGRENKFIFGIGVGCLVVIAASTTAKAQTGFWDRPAIRACCSEADALYADDWRMLADGSIIAKVTGGGPRGHAWAPVGREYKIPREKVRDREGNPTGRPLLFLNKHNQEWVFCFVPGAMI